MKKDREYCTSFDCMTKTCGRHRCHLPKTYVKPLVWTPFHEEGCDLYKTMRIWKTIFRDDDDDV